MKLFKPSMIALSLLTSSSLFAATTAVTNATVYTSTQQGVLENATVVFEDGKITAINPSDIKADNTIDAQGKILTPGFISALSQVGLVEVGAVAGSRDATAKKMDITFDPSYAYNPESSIIPYTRKGGITRSVVAPSSWSETFIGQAFTVLMNSELDSIVDTKVAVVASFGSSSKGSRASSLLELESKLKGQKDKLAKAAEKSDEEKDKAKEPSDEEALLTALLQGEKPLVAKASRASDLLTLIKLKKEYGIKLVISGGQDSAKVKTQLAEAGVPVLLQAMDNLPGSFDSLNASLTTAAELEDAGVTVGFILTDSHMSVNLRYDAGNAVSNGMSKVGAIKAMTANLADIFNLDSGRIAVGQDADIVLWSGDPLEFSSKVDGMWIKGEKVTTESRHDKLRDRYTSKENKPRAYIK